VLIPNMEVVSSDLEIVLNIWKGAPGGELQNG
jgi:hypothetical protein